ncbi:MAG: AtpZ/AtpI family protein [Patescibacteria group bacterium]|jgi:F0F1-type ATP synthase assembly protein I
MTELEPKKNDEKPWWQPSLILFFQLSGWIAGPIVLAIFLGDWLDQKYGLEPWGYLGAVLIAFIISTVGIVREGGKAIKQMEEFKPVDKTKDKNHER